MVNWKYGKPSTDEEIEKVENELGFKFPNQYKSIIKKYNGGRPTPNVFDISTRKGLVFNSLITLNKIPSVYKRISKESSGIIPFADDPSGNIIAFKNNAIVLWDHETNKIYSISSSFNSLLNSLYDPDRKKQVNESFTQFILDTNKWYLV